MDNVRVFHNLMKNQIKDYKLNFQWKEDYTTDVKLRLSYEESLLIINFDIFEDEIRRGTTHNNDKVYEDSCVECFFKIPNSDEYYNFEISATSYMLVAKGKTRNNRNFFSDSVIDKIERKVSILDERPNHCHWQLELKLDLVEWNLLPKNKDIVDHRIKANFYKCGDKLKSPHYFSLFNVDSKNPNFHNPKSFKELIFC